MSAEKEGRLPAIEGYSIVSKLGEGGFGTVYCAEQEEPVPRLVALKVIRADLDSRGVLDRFDLERRALACMDHPNVAQVYEAGIAIGGRPWFAMRFVNGVPITRYADEHDLGITERLKLFQRVCDGIQHAHQKGIIHRDIKPENVLVHETEAGPEPVVIDFGVAKAIDPIGAATPRLTRVGMIVGTPEYMSPEQCGRDSADVDTRSDVYSLGALLYELIVGRGPFDSADLRAGGFERLSHIVREMDPPRPSQRLVESGACDPILLRELRGSLDWIVMKALSKDRAERYSSPGDLRTDIERYLTLTPVAARPPTALYRVERFVRKNRASVILFGVFLGAISIALICIVRFWRDAEEARANESLRAQQLQRVVNLQEKQLGLLPQAVTAGLLDELRRKVRTVAYRSRAGRKQAELQVARLELALDGVDMPSVSTGLLEKQYFSTAMTAIEVELSEDPELRGRLYTALAHMARGLGLGDVEADAIRSALVSYQRSLGPSDPDSIRVLVQWGGVNRRRADFQEAEMYLREAIVLADAALGTRSDLALQARVELGATLRELDRGDESLALLEAAHALSLQQFGLENSLTLSARRELALWEQTFGHIGRSVSLLRSVYETRHAVLGLEHLETLEASTDLAAALLACGEYGEAATHCEPTLLHLRRLFGNNHTVTLGAVRNRGIQLMETGTGQPIVAYQRLNENLQGCRKLWGDDHPATSLALLDRARWHLRTGDAREALRLSNEAACRSRDFWGECDERALRARAFRLATIIAVLY